MLIQSITRTAFNQLHPRRSASWIQEEVEWFAERSRALVAYIATNGRAADWSIVIEGRDERGDFHPIESRTHIATLDEARTLVERTMKEVLGTGLKVFPRGRAGFRPFSVARSEPI
jgi:hypothetical protein